MSVPSEFIGTFKLERSENFDEFLSAKGINWFLRKMMGLSGITKMISVVNDSSKYNMTNLTGMKTVDYGDWTLNETFESIGFDGKTHKITFGVDGNSLTEKHIRSGDVNDLGEIYKYTREDDYLVLTMNYKDITCKRFFKKVDAK